MPTDPVCGKDIDPIRAGAVGIWGGRTYYFCSVEHKAEFSDRQRGVLVSAPGPRALVAASAAAAAGVGSAAVGAADHRRVSLRVMNAAPAGAAAAGGAAPMAMGGGLGGGAADSAAALVAEVPGALLFNVRGMTCASCVSRVEGALRSVPGVRRAAVNLASETAAVDVGRKVEPAALARAVAAAGYELHARTPVAIGAAPARGERQQRLAATRRDAILASALAAALMVVAMTAPSGALWALVVQAALAAPAVLWAGRRFLVTALRQARHASASMDTLIALGGVAALGASVLGAVRGGSVYFETAAAIVAFALVGRWLEERARGETGRALEALARLRPSTVRRLDEGGGETVVPTDALRAGDRIRLRPGEHVPVDGLVAEGNAAVDESLVTGEPMPVERGPGGPVAAGTLVASGSIDVRVERVGADATLGRIARRVEEAQGSRAPIQRLADRVSSVFVPLVLALAALVLVARLASGAELEAALIPALTVLVVACPCALGLATPTALVVAVGEAARHGVLFRTAEGLETLARIDLVLMDKTGTLTAGKPHVLSVTVVEGDRADLVAWVAGAETRSEHPLGRALAAFADKEGIRPRAAERFRQVAGGGVVADVGGQTAVVGNLRLLEREGVPLGAAQDLAVRLAGAGRTLVFAALGGRLQGAFTIGDAVRSNAASAVAQLRALGVGVVMVTGDTAEAAAAAAAEVGISAVRAGVEPDGKADLVGEFRRASPDGKRVVAMVGDGINDAPALAAADVGIAVGGGADAAVEAADVTLGNADVTALVVALRIARRTLWVIRQNLAFAFAYNAVGLTLAATGSLGRHGPMIASAAMALSSVTVVANALRLRGEAGG